MDKRVIEIRDRALSFFALRRQYKNDMFRFREMAKELDNYRTMDDSIRDIYRNELLDRCYWLGDDFNETTKELHFWISMYKHYKNIGS